MKKTVYIFGLCAFLLLMPTLIAFPTTNNSSLLIPTVQMSDGTFAGGVGRGHWGNGGFNVDTVYAYMSGVYSGGAIIRISADITKDYEKIGEINALIGYKIIYGSTTVHGLKTPIIGFLIRNHGGYFIGRIMSITMPAPHIWGHTVPNI